MRYRGEEGQAVVVVAVAMSFFLVAAIGLGVDGSHLYAQRQMAQTAADAAALSAIQSVFEGTYNATGNPAKFGLTAFTCTTTDARTPCVYAANNGFGSGAADTVAMSFPSSLAGVSLAAGFGTELAKATVSRSVNTTLLRLVRFVAPTATTVTATATAAIVSVVAPVPIIVNHPTLASSFAGNGNVGVTICGGPHRSIQVNSSNGTATSTAGSSNLVNLTHAGPPDTGNCLTGNGADLGVSGGPANASSFTVSYGSTGKYLDKTERIDDPLAAVNPPDPATLPTHLASSQTAGAANGGCPASPKKPCELFYPGKYATGLDGKNKTPILAPGIYYIQSNGVDCTANCNMYMATGITDTGAGTTNTGWNGTVLGGGVMFYNTGGGVFQLGSNGSVNLIGSLATGPYKGILFFQDRTAPAATHSLGGGGAMTLLGTIYMTNTKATMFNTASHYQELDLQGGPGSTTYINGEIIVDSLQLGGNANITMNLNNASVTTAQIALVN